MAQCGEVVDLVRPRLLQQPQECGHVREVADPRFEPAAGVGEQLSEPGLATRLRTAAGPHHGEHAVALGKQQFRKMETILPRASGDQRRWRPEGRKGFPQHPDSRSVGDALNPGDRQNRFCFYANIVCNGMVL